MWKCKKCNERIEDTFDTCWNCGSGEDGSVLEDFDNKDESIQAFINKKEATIVADSSTSDYATTKAVSQIISFLGWLVVIGGVITIFAGIGYGKSLVLMLPGLGASISGLFLIVAGQITRATVDNASHTKEILKIMREKT